jgi:hypothetical protein
MTTAEFNSLQPKDVLIKRTNGFRVVVVRIDLELDCIVTEQGVAIYDWEIDNWDFLLRP